ncbi:Protein fam72a [Mortierella sp. AM989]|nr:Protein fam72a [Mortierella sp. AM989]
MSNSIRGFFLRTNNDNITQYINYNTITSSSALGSNTSNSSNTSRDNYTPTPSSRRSVSRMPQYPQYQYQHHPGTGAPPANTPGYYSGTYYNPYYGGANSNRYNTGYSNYYIPSGNGPHGHSGTQAKIVCRMDCKYCSAVVCLRGMKAMLLADTSVELYSTDCSPGSVQLIEKDYTTSNCKCKIRDVACRVCGNIIGYHITQPCQQCLKAPNNGHFWMFHTEGVVGHERLNMDLGKLVHKLITPSPSQPRDSTSSDSISNNSNSINRTTPVGERFSEASTTRQTSTSRQQQQRSFSSPATPMPSSPISSPIRRGSDSDASETTTTSQTTLVSSPDMPLQTASAVLATLSIARFLQPMRWDQLPHPDLDIDLDPSAMGGEPLFAEQWTDMVIKTAEAAAANMSLALDQEEETERFLEKMLQEQKLELENSDSDDEEECEDETDDNDSLPELEPGDEARPRDTLEETMEQLIDQVDVFGLSSLSEECKDDDVQLDGSGENLRGTRTLNYRQQESQPDAAPAPGQHDPASSSSVSITAAPNLSSNRERSRRRRSATSTVSSTSSPLETCPSFALNSARIAKAAASAAAADATSAANSLLYGRRIRRDYDMMCR